MTKRLFIFIGMMVIIPLIITGCIPGDGTNTSSKPAGFFWGIWHGWMAPISLIVGLFKKDIRIYEVVNIGWWYDFGFYIAIISGFGGLSLSRSNKSKKSDD